MSTSMRSTTTSTSARPNKPGCRSEEHTSELQSRLHLVCRLLLEKKKKKQLTTTSNEHQQTNHLLQPANRRKTHRLTSQRTCDPRHSLRTSPQMVHTSN